MPVQSRRQPVKYCANPIMTRLPNRVSFRRDSKKLLENDRGSIMRILNKNKEEVCYQSTHFYFAKSRTKKVCVAIATQTDQNQLRLTISYYSSIVTV